MLVGDWSSACKSSRDAFHLVAGDNDLQHGNQTHVAVLRARVVGASGLRIVGSGEGRAFDPLDLALRVVGRPVEHVHGIGQVIRVDRPELQIEEDGMALIQLGDLDAEGVIAVKRIDVSGHLVTLAIAIQDAVVIQIAGDGWSVRRPGVKLNQRCALKPVETTVSVRVRAQRIGVPVLVRVPEPQHLDVVRDGVTIGVAAQRTEAQLMHLNPVRKPVAIRVWVGGIGAHELLVDVDQTVAVGVRRDRRWPRPGRDPPGPNGPSVQVERLLPAALPRLLRAGAG